MTGEPAVAKGYGVASEIDIVRDVYISLAPARLDRYPRGVAGHVAFPKSSIRLV